MPAQTPQSLNDARALFARAHAAAREGNAQTALALLAQAHALTPKDAEILHALGMATLEAGYRPDAVRHLRRAVALRPRHAPWQRDLGNALIRAAQFHQALTALGRARDLEPSSSDTHALLASALHLLRRDADAEREARVALDLDRSCGGAAMTLARILMRSKRHDEAERTLRGVASNPRESIVTRATAHHLLGDILERRADYDGAFEAHDRGNRLFASMPATRVALAEGLHLRIDEYLADGAPATYARWGAERFDDGRAPVFLVGFPRSGTTLTEQILGAHPRVVTTDERGFLEAVYHRAREIIAARSGADTPLLEGLDALSRDDVLGLRSAYRDLVRAEIGRSADSKLIVDKNPLQILSLGLAARIFPEAPIIVVHRDPRDCCLSALFQPFEINPGTAHMLGVESTGAYYALVMRFWLRLRELIANPRLEIRYEDIVTNFEPSARRLVEFVGLEWSDKVLHFHESASSRAVSSSSYAAVTEKINTRAMGRWSNYESHLKPLMRHVRPFLSGFGYEE